MRRIAVVGGGIAGLAAAWELSGGAEVDPDAPSVVLLEAGRRIGGKLCTSTFAGRPVDRGPDAFLGRRPEAADLCRELGLADELEPIGARGAAVWVGRRRRPLPSHLVFGIPTRFLPAARSRILGWRGTADLLRDVVAPRADRRGPLGDRAVGPLVAHKLGFRVVERLVEPLMGGVYAGGVADMSAAAVFPGLLEAAGRRGSFMRAVRVVAASTGAGGGDDGPAFWSLRRGLGSLSDRLIERLSDRGAELRFGSAVRALERPDESSGRWRITTDDGAVEVDGLILAVPAPAAAQLLEPLEPEAAALLRSIEYASVAVVTASFAADQLPEPLFGTGLLVPRGSPAPDKLGGAYLVTACTYLSAKWPHLARADEVLVRASVGRLGDERFETMNDDELAQRVGAELGSLLGADGQPSAIAVDRWPAALPQYRVHHALRVAGVEAALQRLGGLAVAGAAFHGVGIPACVASGRRAGRQLRCAPASSGSSGSSAPDGTGDQAGTPERAS